MKPDVRAAVAAALTEPEGAAPAPAPETPADGTAPAKGPEAKAGKEGETPVSQAVGTETPEADLKAIEAFQAQWKVDLSALPDDAAREKFITDFKETNKTISSLQREVAELRVAKEATPPTPPVAPAAPSDAVPDVSSLTDEQLAEALGFDLENSDSPERDLRDVALVRQNLELAQRLERLESSTSTDLTNRTWTQALDRLESDFGPLPEGIERADLLAVAAKEGIASPEAAYWAVQGPIRATVASALETRLIELRTDQKRAASGAPRPRTDAPVDEGKLTSTNVKDGIKEAFEKARAALGVDLQDG